MIETISLGVGGCETRSTITEVLIKRVFSFQVLVEHLLPVHPELETHLREEMRRGISIGVGPGADLVAFLALARSRGYINRLVY